MRRAWFRHSTTQSILSACLLASLPCVLSQQVAAEIPWRSDLTTAHAEAKEQNKPLLLHFYSDNCVWCDRLEAGAFQSPQVGAAVDQEFIAVKIHAAQSPELAKMFQVTKFPTDVVVTPAGKTLSHSVSPQDPSRYVAMLAQASNEMRATSAVTDVPVTSGGSMPHVDPVSQLASDAAGPMSSSSSPAPQDPPPHAASVPPTGGMSLPGGASARLAGARTDGMTLGMPAQMAGPEAAVEASVTAPAERPSDDSSSAKSDSAPKLAMEGYCAVTVIDEDKWVEGNPKFGAVHLGKLYLFESNDKMETFLANPVPYTPVLNEIDVVRFFEERQIVPGKRRFGMRDPIHQRMFFFADEAAMNHFFNEYERYTDAAIEVMQQAVTDANPNAN